MSYTARSDNLGPGGKQGQSGNPTGRPRGSRNRVTLVTLAAMEEGADAIARRVVEMAKGGDISAARLVLERLVPPVKERPIFVALPDTGSAEGVAQAQAAILHAVAAGDILPGEAVTLSGIVEARRRALETKPKSWKRGLAHRKRDRNGHAAAETSIEARRVPAETRIVQGLGQGVGASGYPGRWCATMLRPPIQRPESSGVA